MTNRIKANTLYLKFAGYQGAKSIHTKAARKFGSLLLENSSHNLSFELEESILDLGRKSGDLPGMLAAQEIDFSYNSSIRFSEQIPELKLFELPFLFVDRDHLFNSLSGELGDLIEKQFLMKTPYKVLGFWDNGFRHLSNSVRPIRKPQDCIGLTIRTQMSPLPGEFFSVLGFKPIAADIREFLDEIESDRFQAQDNPLTSIYIFNIHRYHKYITLTGHILGLTLFLCNRASYEAWPDEVKRIVIEAANLTTVYQRQLAAEQDSEILSKLTAEENKIITLSPEERRSFQVCLLSLMESYRTKLGPRLFQLI